MAATAADILGRRYGIAPERLSVIPHGVPDRPLRDPDELKPRFGWQGRKVLMTFGLIASNKEIRHMIEAMPSIVAEHPDALYEIVGATHPNLVRSEGECHRAMLIELARKLGVEDHVSFVDRFVEQDELLDILRAADLYITPYLNMAQVTSGTLAYAVAVGKPVISTPYVHAREILADGHGLMVPPSDAEIVGPGNHRAIVRRRAAASGGACGLSARPRNVVAAGSRAFAGFAREGACAEPAACSRGLWRCPHRRRHRMTDGVGCCSMRSIRSQSGPWLLHRR